MKFKMVIALSNENFLQGREGQEFSRDQGPIDMITHRRTDDAWRLSVQFICKWEQPPSGGLEHRRNSLLFTLLHVSVIVFLHFEPHPCLWGFPPRHELKLSDGLLGQDLQTVNYHPCLLRSFANTADLPQERGI